MKVNELKKIFSDLKSSIINSSNNIEMAKEIDVVYDHLNKQVYADIDLNVNSTFKSLVDRLKIDIKLAKKERIRLVNTKTKGITLFQRIKIQGKKLIKDIKKIGLNKITSINKRVKKSFNKVKTIYKIESHKIIERTKLFFGKKANIIVELEKEWHCRFIRSRDLHKSLHGQVVGVHDSFEIAGYTALYPGGFGVAKMDCNCHCKIKLRRKRDAI